MDGLRIISRRPELPLPSYHSATKDCALSEALVGNAFIMVVDIMTL